MNTQSHTIASSPRSDRTLRLLLLSASAVALVATALPARAAEAADAAAPTALEEVIVTARKREENIQNIPVAVTAVSAKKLDDYGLRSMEAISASIPQLNIVRGNSGSGATISLRGIGSTFTSIGIEQSVAVNLDGVYYGQGRIINEGFFDMKQVEILRGPQALFFGKNASAGVISFRSADPGDHFEALARAGYEFKGKVANFEGVVSGPVTNVSNPILRATESRKRLSVSVPTTATSAPLERATRAQSIPIIPGPETTTSSPFPVLAQSLTQ